MWEAATPPFDGLAAVPFSQSLPKSVGAGRWFLYAGAAMTVRLPAWSCSLHWPTTLPPPHTTFFLPLHPSSSSPTSPNSPPPVHQPVPNGLRKLQASLAPPCCSAAVHNRLCPRLIGGSNVQLAISPPTPFLPACVHHTLKGSSKELWPASVSRVCSSHHTAASCCSLYWCYSPFHV